MRVQPIVVRSFQGASRVCKDRFSAIYEKRVRPLTIDNRFAKSIIGRITICAVAEALGGLAASYAGEMLLGAALQGIGRYSLPILAFPLTLLSLRHKTARAALPVLGIGVLWQGPISMAQLTEWGATGGLALGQFLGKNIGTILGGYAGLKAVESNIPFWDRSTWCDSYLIGMTKYLVVGEVFNLVITKASLPYLHVPINLARALINYLFKTCAYNSNTILYTLKGAKISKEVIVPLVVKTLCNRYCEVNSAPITDKLVKIISMSSIPRATFLLKKTFIFSKLQSKVQSLGKKTDRLATVLMRGFRSYLQLYKTSAALRVAYQNYLDNPKANNQIYKERLKEAIQGTVVLSPILGKSKDTFQTMAKSLLQTIQQAEVDLVGVQLTETNEFLEETLAIHLKYCLIHTIHKFDDAPLSQDEEKQFFHEINDLLFSLYPKPQFSHRLARFVRRFNHMVISSLFGFKKWIYPVLEQPEQKALIFTGPEIKENQFEADPEAEYQFIDEDQRGKPVTVA